MKSLCASGAPRTARPSSVGSTAPVPWAELEGSRKESSAGEADAVCKSWEVMTWRRQTGDGRGTPVTSANKTGASLPAKRCPSAKNAFSQYTNVDC